MATQPDYRASPSHPRPAAGIAPAALAADRRRPSGRRRPDRRAQSRPTDEGIHDDGGDDAARGGRRQAGRRQHHDDAARRDGTAGLLEAANDIEIARVAKLTGVAEGGGDSLHRLVSARFPHKALNRLARIAPRRLSAAPTCSAALPRDPRRGSSFMEGLNRAKFRPSGPRHDPAAGLSFKNQHRHHHAACGGHCGQEERRGP